MSDEGIRLKLSDGQWIRLRTIAKALGVSVGKMLANWIESDLAGVREDLIDRLVDVQPFEDGGIPRRHYVFKGSSGEWLIGRLPERSEAVGTVLENAHG